MDCGVLAWGIHRMYVKGERYWSKWIPRENRFQEKHCVGGSDLLEK